MAEPAPAPTPAPAPAPAPAPSKTPAPPAPPAPKKEIQTPDLPLPDTTFNDEIDKLAGRQPKPKPKPKAAEKPEDKEPDPPKPPKPDDKPGDDGDDDPPKGKGQDEDEYDVPVDPPKKKEEKPLEKAPELRQAYETTKKRVAELEKELKEIREKPASDPEKVALTERLKEREERLQKLEDEIKLVNYEKSSEYQEQYDTPLVKAYQAGQAKAKALKVTDPDSGELRQGTPDDFAAIMQITDEDAAAELATELFGTKAPMVLFHRERVMELNAKRVQAIEEYRTKGKERDKEIEARTAAQKAENEKSAAARRELFTKSRDEAAEKYPHLFKPIDGDEKGNELLTKGFAKVDQVFGSRPEGMTPEQVVKLHAMVRNKAGAFDRLNYQHKQAKARIAELEAELEQYQESAPNGGLDRRGAKTGGDVLSIDAEIDALAAQNSRR